ncbi:MAG: FAD-dependent oxidoreductase [Robiginitomaculum sp.]|nr:FAD-dependent oxidoreductase [Robiginitomaculum sp.]MDQ7078223.1 FAD-dependent oxidoreductase [Robiginitomaculum sp.]
MSRSYTILGAGFAAITAARKLRALDVQAKITMIAPRAEFIYLPSLIWIPCGKRTGDDLRIPLAKFIKRHDINFIEASASGVTNSGRMVSTSTGDVENDGLIIACGGRFIKKLPGIEHVITPCEGIPAAETIRDRLAALSGGTIACGFAGNPKEPAAMRGGPMFEFLFGIDRQLRKEKRRKAFKLVFFCPAPRPGARLGEAAVDRLLGRMKELDIDIHIGHKIKGFTADTVTTEGGQFNADLILFMPGMTGNAWFKDSELPLSPGGMIRANKLCQVDGMAKTYVAGDAGSFPGPGWMPKQAHMADLQADAAANNLVDELNGKTPSEEFRTELVCLIDSMDKGALVYRTEKRQFMLPPLRVGHWAKRAFERQYLKRLR